MEKKYDIVSNDGKKLLLWSVTPNRITNSSTIIGSLEKKAKANNPRAMLRLANIFYWEYEQYDVLQNIDKAAFLWIKAASLNCPEACYELSVHYKNSIHPFSKDVTQSKLYAQKAAQNKFFKKLKEESERSPKAKFHLARCYYADLIKPKNQEETSKLLRQAGDNGITIANYMLLTIVNKSDTNEFLEFYKNRIKFDRVLYEFGNICTGKGDHINALRYYCDAYKSGFVYATYMIALILLDSSCEKDIILGLSLAKEAMLFGFPVQSRLLRTTWRLKFLKTQTQIEHNNTKSLQQQLLLNYIRVINKARLNKYSAELEISSKKVKIFYNARIKYDLKNTVEKQKGRNEMILLGFIRNVSSLFIPITIKNIIRGFLFSRSTLTLAYVNKKYNAHEYTTRDKTTLRIVSKFNALVAKISSYGFFHEKAFNIISEGCNFNTKCLPASDISISSSCDEPYDDDTHDNLAKKDVILFFKDIESHSNTIPRK